MSGRLLKCLLAAFVIQVALPSVGSACTCGAGPRVRDRAAYQEWFQQRTAVFRGTVVADELLPERRSPGSTVTLHQRKVTFSVERQWKGVDGSTIVVVTNVDGSMCGVDFRQGSRYLVAADGRPVFNADLTSSETPQLMTDICTGSWLSDQKAFLDTFGEGQPPNPRR